MEVVEGFKEGYESDVLEPEMPLSAAEDKKKTTDMSDEEDNTKENSDEDFNIDNYVADNNELLETTAESSSIRCLLHV